MPVVVNHEERRAKVVAAASAVMARKGAGGVTVREVAREAGYSTAVVSHFFRDKRELIHLVFQTNVAEGLDAAERARVATNGDLKAVIEPSLITDDVRRARWQVWLAYIAQVVVEPEIAALQHESVNNRIDHLKGVLDDLAARGDLSEGVDTQMAAQRLLAMMTGVAVQALVDPAAWPAERQHALVDAELASLHRSGRAAAAST